MIEANICQKDRIIKLNDIERRQKKVLINDKNIVNINKLYKKRIIGKIIIMKTLLILVSFFSSWYNQYRGYGG